MSGTWWPESRGKDLIAYLNDDEHARLLACMEPTSVAAGEPILHKDSPSRSLLLIESGEVDVIEQSLGETVVLATLGPGRVVGEVGFLDGRPRTHDVRARTDCQLRRLTRDHLLDLARGDTTLFAKVVIGLAELVADRFRSAVQELEPLRAFARTLSEPMEASADFDEIDEPIPESALEMLRDLARHPGKDAAGV